MKEINITLVEGSDHKYVDDEGDQYTFADDNEQGLIEAIDAELSIYNLELYIGNAGSSDNYICIKERETEEDSK